LSALFRQADVSIQLAWRPFPKCPESIHRFYLEDAMPMMKAYHSISGYPAVFSVFEHLAGFASS
jgi:hypothetical protein